MFSLPLRFFRALFYSPGLSLPQLLQLSDNKTKSFFNELTCFFIQRKTIHGLGEHSTSQSWSTLPEGSGARAVLQSFSRGNVEVAWLTRRPGFPSGAGRSRSLREGKARLEACDWCVLGFLGHVSHAGWLRFWIVMWARPLWWPPFCGSPYRN